MSSLAWIGIALAAGMVPFPYLIARSAGRGDVIAGMRHASSRGDAHALVARGISPSAGAAAVALDMAKAGIPAIVATLAGAGAGTLALMGIAAVAGHTFTPLVRFAAGRGLAAAAGAALAVVPVAMVASGTVALAGTLARRGGPGTTLGFALLPVFAVLFGYSPALIGMTLGMLLPIALRRIEGIGDDIAAGVPARIALASRLVHDEPPAWAGRRPA